jgi:hypothetical protein
VGRVGGVGRVRCTPTVWSSVLALCLASAQSVHGGQEVEWPGRWASVIAETQRLLESGDGTRAREPLASLLRDLLDRDPPSDKADSRLGHVLTRLALAETSAGATDDATWHWHVAQNVDRSVASLDLSRYGNLGAALSATVLPPVPARCVQSPGSPSAPKILERREMKPPGAVSDLRERVIVLVQVEVDARGRPVRPQVFPRRPGALVFSALEALRAWRFEVKPEASDMPFCLVFAFLPG